MSVHEDLIRNCYAAFNARDLDGDVIADQNVQHVYTIRAGLIARMDIRNA